MFRELEFGVTIVAPFGGDSSEYRTVRSWIMEGVMQFL